MAKRQVVGVVAKAQWQGPAFVAPVSADEGTGPRQGTPRVSEQGALTNLGQPRPIFHKG